MSFILKETATEYVAKYVHEEGWKDQCDQLSFLQRIWMKAVLSLAAVDTVCRDCCYFWLSLLQKEEKEKQKVTPSLIAHVQLLPVHLAQVWHYKAANIPSFSVHLTTVAASLMTAVHQLYIWISREVTSPVSVASVPWLHPKASSFCSHIYLWVLAPE